jgi:HSP20 family protein
VFYRARQRLMLGADCEGVFMNRNFHHDWMWSEAFEMLARAERLHREFYRPVRSTSKLPTWEPPVDILETAREILIVVALPGVDLERVEAAIEGGDLIVAGTRVLPRAFNTAVIHRLELPQGQFERRVRLPAGHYQNIRLSADNGCLLITLDKAEVSRG